MIYSAFFQDLKNTIDTALQKNLYESNGPPRLLEAMAYSLFAGGKRVRPMLLLATRSIFPPGGLDPIIAACALEYIHTYSLIHDDLPAMDDDDLRRGKPTNHKKFGEAMAILAGDALLTEAFALIARSYAVADDSMALRILGEIATAAGAQGMVGGQVRDTLGVGEPLEQRALEKTHRMKTGALLLTAVRCGGIIGGAGKRELATLTRFGKNIGLAFQVADDVLDVVGSKETLGKTAGKDAAQNKITFPTLLGVERSRRYALTLADQAVAELEQFGSAADHLRELASFIARMPRLFETAHAGETARVGASSHA